MNGQVILESKCRICWAGNEEVDWNNLMCNHAELSYRDCFYKYTQIESIEDRFSSMICLNCSNGLEYIHDFISEAIERNAKLQEMFLGSLNNKEKIVAADCESIYVEEIEIKEECQTIIYGEDKDFLINGNLFDQSRPNRKDKDSRNSEELNSETRQSDYYPSDNKVVIDENEAEKDIKDNKGVIEEIAETNEFTLLIRQLRKHYTELSNSSSKRQRKRNNKKSVAKSPNEEEIYKYKLTKLKSKETDIKKFVNPVEVSSDSVPEKVLVDKTKTGEKIFLCQYCSAEIKGWSRLHAHEAKHNGVRKRTETCSQCGVKFFTKASLRLHEKTHDANREKKFKCEFCEKAFYNMGALNVHKRIHLGLMVKCQICSKEFFRNIELYRHMNSHSSSLINVEVKKRSRYFVRCKHCGKKILSTSFKSHTAAHLKQPLVKCAICNKEYFNRVSCRHHIRTIHMKKPDTVNNFVVLLNTDRLTHLYILQNADIEPKEK